MTDEAKPVTMDELDVIRVVLVAKVPLGQVEDAYRGADCPARDRVAWAAKLLGLASPPSQQGSKRENQPPPQPDKEAKPEPANEIQVVSHDGRTQLFVNDHPVRFESLTLKATPAGTRLECVFECVEAEIVERHQ